MGNGSVFRRDIDFNLPQSVTIPDGGCYYTGGGISVYCYHGGFLYLSGLGVPSGHFKRTKIDGGFDRLSFMIVMSLRVFGRLLNMRTFRVLWLRSL